MTAVYMMIMLTIVAKSDIHLRENYLGIVQQA
jgi:hypothetical protein